MPSMTSSLSKYDVVVVKFPFSDIAALKARPAAIISNKFYNNNSRNSLLVVGISSKIKSKLDFEKNIEHWQKAGLLKPSIFKSAIATIDKNIVLKQLGSLSEKDIEALEDLLALMLGK